MRVSKHGFFGAAGFKFPQSKIEKKRHFKLPLALGILGLCSLSFRFDMNSKIGFNAYVLNLFFYFVITSILLIFFNKALTTKFTVGFYLIYVIIFSLPWKILDFLKLNYYQDQPRQHVIPEDVKKNLTENLANSIKVSNFDHKFFLYFLITIAVLFLVIHQRKVVTGYVAAALLVSWNFTSYASPYSWVPSFERPINLGYLYGVSHFASGSGVVNADEPAHSGTTFILQGYDGSAALIRRPLSNYFVSQFSYFTNQYYVWISLNFAVWVAVIYAVNYFCQKANLLPISRSFTLLLFATSPLLLSYFGQSSAYFFGISATIIVTALIYKIQEMNFSKNSTIALSGLILGCYLLVYDGLPWIVAILIGLSLNHRKTSSTISMKIASIAVSLYFLYRYFIIFTLDIAVDQGNEGILSQVIGSVIRLVADGNYGEIYQSITSSGPNYLWMIIQGITLLPFATIFLGLFSARFSPQSAIVVRGKRDTKRETEQLYSVNKLVLPFFLIGLLIQFSWHLSKMENIGLIPRVNGGVLLAILLYAGYCFDLIIRKYPHLGYFLFILTSIQIVFFNLGLTEDSIKFYYYIVQGKWIAWGN